MFEIYFIKIDKSKFIVLLDLDFSTKLNWVSRSIKTNVRILIKKELIFIAFIMSHTYDMDFQILPNNHLSSFCL